MVIYRLHLSFIKSFHIFRYVLLIVFEQLPLKLKRAAEVIVTYISVDHFGHSTKRHIFPEQSKKHIELQLRERFQFVHVAVKSLNKILRITLGPQKFLKVHRVHLIVLFIANAVRLYFPVVYAHQRTRANHVITTVNLKEFQRSGTIRTGLQLVKKQQRVICHKLVVWIQQRNILYY